MQVNYGMAAKAVGAAAVATATYFNKVSENTEKHTLTILGANLLAQKGFLCNQVATAVQVFAGLSLLRTAVDNYAPESVKDWTVGYMTPLVSVIGGAALATVFANRGLNINKF